MNRVTVSQGRQMRDDRGDCIQLCELLRNGIFCTLRGRNNGLYDSAGTIAFRQYAFMLL